MHVVPQVDTQPDALICTLCWFIGLKQRPLVDLMKGRLRSSHNNSELNTGLAVLLR